MHDLGIDYPVALDNDYAIWKRFNNQYWPAHYFIDANGSIRDHHFGEGDYDESEQLHPRSCSPRPATTHLPGGLSSAGATGAQAAWLGDADAARRKPTSATQRAANFASPAARSPRRRLHLHGARHAAAQPVGR